MPSSRSMKEVRRSAQTNRDVNRHESNRKSQGLRFADRDIFQGLASVDPGRAMRAGDEMGRRAGESLNRRKKRKSAGRPNPKMR